MLNEALSLLFESAGAQSINLAKYYFWSAPENNPLHDEKWLVENLQPKGYFFGSVSPRASGLRKSGFQWVAVVRDPRDILVSHYFSLKHAHIPGGRKQRAEIERTQNLTLEEYVVDKEIHAQFIEYYADAKNAASDESAFVTRYEDLVEQPVEAFRTILSKCHAEVGEKELQAAADKTFLDSSSQRGTNAHRRSGVWGQYRELLSDSAIAAINSSFGEYLNFFGYPEGKDAELGEASALQ